MAPTRTTIEVSSEVAKAARVYAAEQEISLKWLTETALLAYITRWPKVAPSLRQARQWAQEDAQMTRKVAARVKRGG